MDLDLFAGPAPERHRKRVVWCSSPDRGLHHLLSFWPMVRKHVPDAELRVFYRLKPWLENCRNLPDAVGTRARYVEQALAKLSGFGVQVMDLVPNAQMANELRSAAVLAYPCDPVSYTEGFGCSVLDAAAGGCMPFITNADALEQVHGKAAVVFKRPVNPQEWAMTLAAFLGGSMPDLSEVMRAHAAAHSRQVVTDQWERLLQEGASA